MEEVSPIKRKVQTSSNSESESDIVQLDIGGTIFRTTKYTLTRRQGYFRAMFDDQYVEGSQSGPIFIDRDPHTFGSILSFLRTGEVFFTSEDDTVYLQRLMAEASFYHLDDLASQLKEEIESRLTEQPTVETVVQQRIVGLSEANILLGQGWRFVAAFEGNETMGCSINLAATTVEASWFENGCSACGEQMIFDKFKRHATSFRPTKVVLSKEQPAGSSTSNRLNHENPSVGGAFRDGLPAALSTASLLSPLRDGAFDQSFG